MQNLLGFLLSGLIFALVCYGFVRLSMTLTLRSGRATLDQINATLARSAPAMAVVVRVDRPSGLLRKPRLGMVRLQLTLDVQPAHGEAYQAISLWQVDQAAVAQLQPGQQIAVTVDADSAATIYPAVPWAAYSWP